jgi:PilZ domain-containing protein
MKRELALRCNAELTGVLLREMPTRLVEISRTGCLLETSHRIAEGTIAALRVELQGRVYTEDVRATRCVAVAGSGTSYLVGIEFLQTSSPDGMSIRRAIAGSLRGVDDQPLWGSGSLSV